MLKREEAITETRLGNAVLITGNTASGKSTLGKQLEEMMVRKNKVTMRLDGENVRMGLCGDLGFSMEDRDENLRRMAEVAKIARDHGVHVIICAVSPLRRHIDQFIDIVGDDLRRVYMSTDHETCRIRDSKGVYDMADQGKAQVPGVNADWEPDFDAHHIIDKDASPMDAARSVYQVMNFPGTKWDKFFQGMTAVQ